MSENIVELDLTRFTPADARKLEALQRKIWAMHRWCRCDRIERDGREQVFLYSGDRSRQPYASYRLCRTDTGAYALHDGRSERLLATARTMDGAIDALPEDFYYARYRTTS